MKNRDRCHPWLFVRTLFVISVCAFPFFDPSRLQILYLFKCYVGQFIVHLQKIAFRCETYL